MTSPTSPAAFALDAAMRGQLAPGERLLWSAAPDPRRLKAAFGIWLFAVPWTVFSLVWTGLAASPWLARPARTAWEWGFGIAFPLFGIPFIIVGLWMLYKPIQVRRDAAATLYGLTDSRIIRVVAGNTRRTESVRLDQMGPIQCKTGCDGWGTITIQTGSHVDSEGDRVTDTFIVAGVPDIEKLHRLIVERQAA